MTNTLEIYTDASIREINGRVFGCAGALCKHNGRLSEDYKISSDTTNNRSELLAIYLGVRLAYKILTENPGMYTEVALYSDSQFGIFGLTRWMDNWLKTSVDGILYGTNNMPVKNQELFKQIIIYMVQHNLKIKFYHQQGHVNYNSEYSLAKANDVFKRSNGFLLPQDEIYKISFYNNMVDNSTRSALQNVNPNNYKVLDYSDGYKILCTYAIPANYKQYVN